MYRTRTRQSLPAQLPCVLVELPAAPVLAGSVAAFQRTALIPAPAARSLLPVPPHGEERRAGVQSNIFRLRLEAFVAIHRLTGLGFEADRRRLVTCRARHRIAAGLRTALRTLGLASIEAVELFSTLSHALSTLLERHQECGTTVIYGCPVQRLNSLL